MTDVPYFDVEAQLPDAGGRSGVIPPARDIRTPAFIAVGTAASVKAVLPENMQDLGAQAVRANAYHLYLQPGPDIVARSGRSGRLHELAGAYVHRQRRVQIMSLGAGFRKVLMEDPDREQADNLVAEGQTERLAHVDDDGRHIHQPSRRFDAPIHPRVSIQDPAPAGSGHHLRVRRADHVGQHRAYQESQLPAHRPGRSAAWPSTVV